MIVDAVIGLVTSMLTGLLSLLPDVEPPDLSGAVDAIDGISAYTGWLNKYFPVSEAITILALVVTVYTGMYVVKFLLWVWSKIPVIGGGE